MKKQDRLETPYKKGIKKARELFESDRLNPGRSHQMTLGAQRKAVREFDEEKVRKVVLERVIKERSIDIARALKKNGVDINIIAISTGLAKKEIVETGDGA